MPHLLVRNNNNNNTIEIWSYIFYFNYLLFVMLIFCLIDILLNIAGDCERPLPSTSGSTSITGHSSMGTVHRVLLQQCSIGLVVLVLLSSSILQKLQQRITAAAGL